MLLCVICEPFLGERDLFFFEGADNIIYLTDLKKKLTTISDIQFKLSSYLAQQSVNTYLTQKYPHKS